MSSLVLRGLVSRRVGSSLKTRRFSTTMETDSTSSDLKQSILDDDDLDKAPTSKTRSSKGSSISSSKPKPPVRWVPTPIKSTKKDPREPKNLPAPFRPKSVAPNLALHKRDQEVAFLAVYYPGERELTISLSSLKGMDPSTRVSDPIKANWRAVEMAAIIRFLTSPMWPQLQEPSLSKLELNYIIGVQKHVPVSLIFERSEDVSSLRHLKITMVKGELTRSIQIEPAEETLLVEFLRSAIATSFGFLPPPKAFW